MDVLIGARLNTLATAPFATGGEGALHDMRWAGSTYAAKLYRVDPRRGDAEHRRGHAEWLVAHPPSRLRGSAEGWTVAWPTELVTTTDGRFLGVAMPRVRDAVRLSELTAHAWTVSRRLGARWAVYELPSRLALALRLQLAERVAQAVAAVHAGGRYVLADLKPDNILVQADARVTLVDCDSVQVAEHGVLLHSAPVRTDDYTPPEGIALAGASVEALSPSWDAFSLAVLVYQLLLGVHPFAVEGVDPATGETVQTVRDAIRAGMYANAGARGGMHAQHMQLHVAPPHGAMVRLPEPLRAAFEQVFVEGHGDPSRRLSALEWARLLATSRGLGGRVLAVRRGVAMRRSVTRAQGQVAWRVVGEMLADARARMRERRAASWRALRELQWNVRITWRDLFCVQAGAMATLFWLSSDTGDRVTAGSERDNARALAAEQALVASWTTRRMVMRAGVPTGAASGAPLLAPVGDVLARRAEWANDGAEAAEGIPLTVGTVLTFTRAGTAVWRDSVIAASESLVTLVRRPLVDGVTGETPDTVRYERTRLGLRLTDSRDGILLLPNGARVGDAWRSDEVPTFTVQATAIRHVQTLAGRFATVELVVTELMDGRMRSRRLWLNAQYGVVRVEEDAPASAVAELVAVTSPDGHQAARMDPPR